MHWIVPLLKAERIAASAVDVGEMQLVAKRRSEVLASTNLGEEGTKVRQGAKQIGNSTVEVALLVESRQLEEDAIEQTGEKQEHEPMGEIGVLESTQVLSVQSPLVDTDTVARVKRRAAAMSIEVMGCRTVVAVAAVNVPIESVDMKVR